MVGLVFMSEHDRVNTPPIHNYWKGDEFSATSRSADYVGGPFPSLVVDFTPPADIRITMII